MNGPVVGIDLGTTNSLAAYVVDGKPVVVRDESGNALVPSVLFFPEEGSPSVGSEAKRRALAAPDRTLFSVKRLMGRTLAELKGEVEQIPHQISERDAGEGRKILTVKIGDRELTPEELSAMILKEVRQRAGNPTRAVVTVPAYFDDAQRQATRDAGRIAGLDILRIVNEPTAAALAYGLDTKKNGTVAVYDLGGGTFDCSILALSDGVFKVLSTHGDTRLGGDDFDRTLMTLFAREAGSDPLRQRDARILQELREAAENAKIALSTQESVTVEVPGLQYQRTLTREEFEALIEPMVDSTIEKCRAALRDAESPKIDEVVLVGGSSRIPLVRRKVEAFFGRKPHTDINPDEVVALGAALQADVLAGGRRDLLLLDVLPLSLGIETLGGVVDKILHRNSAVPCRATTRYTTSADDQTAILLNIYQGERELTKDCRLLGKFRLAGIPPMPAQLAQVDVTFLADADGLLTVSAIERRSGVRARVEVTAPHGLSRDEVEKLVVESIENAREDFSARRFIELKNKAETDLNHTEKALREAGSQLSAPQLSAIDHATSKLKAAMLSSDVDTLQQASDLFNEATTPLAELLMNRAAEKLFTGRETAELDSAVTPPETIS